MMTVETYRHSGGVGALGVPLMCVVGGVGAIVLGIVYSYGLAWIPIIYVSFILTAGFGALLGLMVGAAGKAGKVRNPFIVGVFGLLFAAFGLYIAWAFDGMARFGAPDIPGPIFSPTILSEYISVFYNEGFWGMGRGNNTVSGIFLGVIWAVEALVVLGLGWLLAHGYTSSLPFCESCSRWTDKVEGLCQVLPREGDTMALEQLCDGQVSALREFAQSPPDAGAYFRIDTAMCPDCNDCNCMTVNLVEITVDKDGDNKLESKTLVENMVLSHDDMEQVNQIIEDMPVAEMPETTEAETDEIGTV